MSAEQKRGRKNTDGLRRAWLKDPRFAPWQKLGPLISAETVRAISWDVETRRATERPLFGRCTFAIIFVL
jgi:hypothetical protein